MREIKIYDAMYEADISILIGGTADEMIELVSARHNYALPSSWGEEFEWGKDANTTNGYQFHINAPLGHGEKFYIWMDKISPSLLAHELYHLVGDIMYTRGIKYCNESEEAFAYLAGNLFGKIYKRLRGKIQQ